MPQFFLFWFGIANGNIKQIRRCEFTDMMQNGWNFLLFLNSRIIGFKYKDTRYIQE
jgi:hypothetical protein